MKKNGFMEGAIIATSAIILSKIIGILYVIPFYNIIGTKGGALYGYAYNIYNIFLIISSAGIPLAISKLTSEYETKKEYNKKNAMYSLAKKAIYIFSISSFLICFIFAKGIASIILGNLTGGNTIEDVTYVIRCVSFALLVVPTLSISRGYLQGHKYISSSSTSQVIEQITRIAIILIGSYCALKVFNLELKYAIGISVFAAALGAIVSYIFLYIKLRKAKIVKKSKKITKDEKKEIKQKLLAYCIPFVIINIAGTLYDTTDMILIIQGLTNLGFSPEAIEEISSVFTTWGSKIISIVKAFSTGLTISLIPSIVSAYVLKDYKTVNTFFNKAIQVILFIILPITIFMSIFSDEVWSLFYKSSTYGPIILKYSVLVAVLDAAYVIIYSSLQSLGKNKLIYICISIGLLINIFLDLPLMYLFNDLGIHAAYGAITATVIGYGISLLIALIVLMKKDNFSYIETIKNIPKLLISILIFIIACTFYKNHMPQATNYITNIIYLIIIGIISVGIYYALNYKFINKLLFEKEKK